MEKAIFEKLQAHVFDKDNPWVDIWEDENQKPRPNKLPYIASWAYYDENVDIHTQTLADEVIRGLNNNVVFVARNPSIPLPSTWRFWDLAPEKLGLRAESKPLPELRFLWNDDDRGAQSDRCDF